MKDNQISFQLLWAIFPPGTDVVMTDEASGEKSGFRTTICSYFNSRDGPVFNVQGHRLVFNGDRFVRIWTDAEVPKFKGLRKVSTLPVHSLSDIVRDAIELILLIQVYPMTDNARADLTARGEKYCDLAGVRFLNYSSVLIQVVGHGMDRRIVKIRAEGRAVVDSKSFRRMQPSRAAQERWEDEEDEFGFTSPGAGLVPRKGERPVQTDLCLLPPTVFGFSLVARDWGQLLVVSACCLSACLGAALT